MERKHRVKNTHAKVDLAKPVNIKEVMNKDQSVHGESCFGNMFDIEHRLCAMCACSDMCGIVFHSNQKKRVKEFEKNNPTTLDMNDFDGINKNLLLMWLKTQPRTFTELINKVDSMANCADRETVKLWAKSFVISHKRLSIENKIIIVKS